MLVNPALPPANSPKQVEGRFQRHTGGRLKCRQPHQPKAHAVTDQPALCFRLLLRGLRGGGQHCPGRGAHPSLSAALAMFSLQKLLMAREGTSSALTTLSSLGGLAVFSTCNLPRGRPEITRKTSSASSPIS